MASSKSNSSSHTYAIGQNDDVLTRFSKRTLARCGNYLSPHLRADSHVLDIGCGPRSITVDLAAACPRGRVFGADQDLQAIATAKRVLQKRVANGELSSGRHPEFIVADCFNNLPFDDASLDVVHGHQVAQFVPDLLCALREWRRVLRPGGVLALRVTWLAGMVAAPMHEGISHLIKAVNGSFEMSGGDPGVLQRMPALAKMVGFDEVTVSSQADVIQKREEQVEVAGFFLNEDMVAGWRKQDVVSEAEIDEIRTALEGVQEAENGFFIFPNIELLCRVNGSTQVRGIS